MRLRECSPLILILLTVSLQAHASQWYPIETGRFWVYSSPGGGSFSAMIEDPESFAGSLLQPLRWDTGASEYLSQDGAGRVFLHGVSYPDGGYVVFDPPVLRMDFELAPGDEWEAIYQVIEYNAVGVELWRGQGHATFQVIGVGPVDVAAGTFDAAEVLRAEETVPLAGASLSSGPSLFSSAPQPVYTFREMYAEGVGWIRRTNESGTSLIFELESYGGGVPTEASTWGAVKAQYKD